MVPVGVFGAIDQLMLVNTTIRGVLCRAQKESCNVHHPGIRVDINRSRTLASHLRNDSEWSIPRRWSSYLPALYSKKLLSCAGRLMWRGLFW